MTEIEEKRNKRQTGAYYEQAAGCYLERLGYEVLEYNYRCRSGEIDIVVKFRSDERKGNPLEAVDSRKQKVIFRCAMHYLSEHRLKDASCRFDVIGIEGNDGMRSAKVTHIINAFTG